MTDVETRLADLLTRTADTVAIHPDVESVIEEAALHALHALDPGGRRRRGPLVAAAVAAALFLVVGAALLLLRGGGDDGSQPVDIVTRPTTGTAPSATTGPLPGSNAPPGPYPVLGTLPPEISGTLFSYNVPSEPIPYAEVLFGRPTAGGGYDQPVVALITRDLGADRDSLPFPLPGMPGVTTEAVEGREVTVWRQPDAPTTVILEGARPVALMGEGESPLAFLAALGPDWPALDATDPDLSDLAIRDLPRPPGYDQVISPAPTPGAPRPELSIDRDGGTVLILGVIATEPVVFLADRGPISPVDVNGRSGWVTDGSMAWTAEDGTYLFLEAAVDSETLVAMAEDVHLVDEATWRATYPAGEPGGPGSGIPVNGG